jgi:hypothetical protein
MAKTAAEAQAETQTAVEAAAKALHDLLYPGWGWVGTHEMTRRHYRRYIVSMVEAGVIDLPRAKPIPERPIEGQTTIDEQLA